MLATLSISVAQTTQAERRVALVFDDGPIPGQAEAMRELFAREGIVVTFAHVGQRVQENPKLTRAASEAGHEIVNHSWSHARIAELDQSALVDEVRKGHEAIRSATGSVPGWYWPPYLAVDQRLKDVLAAVPVKIYVPHHLVDSKDWDTATSAETLRQRAITGVRDGSVILFHEWRKETLEQLPAILVELRSQGCTFHTFSGLRESLERRPPADAPDPQTQSMFQPKPAP